MTMAEVRSAEVSKNFATYREMADGSRGTPEPVTMLHHNKPSVVSVAAGEWARLKRRDKRVMATDGGVRGADKDHPACVVATFRQQGRPEDFVVYLPISPHAAIGRRKAASQAGQNPSVDFGV
jgi:PHD/YefM family antitoxin component YafN of YafNO toxin-antitoxin module